ncbi:MAG: SMC-Scp complex subunit ScpB [Deltaproteobacteria bacterium]|nr:SMC-Scp complex subunit ScpB [Deltaproteobacteria bacterium]
MNETELRQVVEGLIFASETPLPLQKIHEILASDELDKAMIRKAIADLARFLEENGSALQVVELAGGYRLVTRKEIGGWIKKLNRPKKVRLSGAALEVLATIAYKQPVTTPEIEAIRGVNSSGVIKTLLERNLIKIAGRMEAVGNPIMYATTREFLEYFGLRSLKDLPTLKEFQEIMEEVEEQEENPPAAEEKITSPGRQNPLSEETPSKGESAGVE